MLWMLTTMPRGKPNPPLDFTALDRLEDARNEGRRDALVNLKKFIREQSGEPIGRDDCIYLIDEFMALAFGPGL